MMNIKEGMIVEEIEDNEATEDEEHVVVAVASVLYFTISFVAASFVGCEERRERCVF